MSFVRASFVRASLVRASLACALWVFASTAFAAQPYVDLEKRLTPQQMHATGLDTLTPAQLSTLNAVLRGDAAQAQADADARVAQAQAAHADAPAHDDAHNDQSRFVGFTDQPIRAHVKGTVAGWEPGTVFVLDNGQQWKVLKGSLTLRKPLESPEIQLVPGIAGRWFLQIDEDTPRPRVYRID